MADNFEVPMYKRSPKDINISSHTGYKRGAVKIFSSICAHSMLSVASASSMHVHSLRLDRNLSVIWGYFDANPKTVYVSPNPIDGGGPGQPTIQMVRSSRTDSCAEREQMSKWFGPQLILVLS